VALVVDKAAIGNVVVERGEAGNKGYVEGEFVPCEKGKDYGHLPMIVWTC